MILKYKENLESIHKFHAEATSLINTWYDFTKDKAQLKKLIYPLRFYFKKNALKKGLTHINTQVENITIENRFIKEKITVWEHELEINSIQRMKEDQEYKSYEALLRQKDSILKELHYLLPSIKGVCPIELNSNALEGVIEKLSTLSAA